jgi:hypothetical protein
MFYAASEIVFWILLSAIIGGGIGYGLSQARSVQIGKRLSESRADAPMERELAIAWDTIEDLNRRLQVAHETIRGGMGDGSPAAADIDTPLEAVPAAAAQTEIDEAPRDEDPRDELPQNGEPQDESPQDDALQYDADEDGDDSEKPSEDGSLVPVDDAEPAEPLTHTVEEVVPSAEVDEAESTDGVVGTRLADRVASASIGNQVEVIKTVEF